MPITLTPFTPTNTLGWGVTVNVTSDFIGPIPSGTEYKLTLASDSEGLNVIASWIIGTTDKSAQLNMSERELGFHQGLWSVATGEQVHLLAQLVEPGNVVIDSGALAAPFQQHAQAPIMVTSDVNAHQGGGLTEEQATQLNDLHAAANPTINLDGLTLVALTPGPSSDPVNRFLPAYAWGVIVRIAEVPAELVPNTPDGDYWFPSLAVVRLFRGSDLWLRVPIHTSSKLIGFATQDLVVGAATALEIAWLLQLSIQVTFREGVTGEVFLMTTP